MPSGQTPVENQAWRVVNAVATESFWGLVEIEFYLESTCAGTKLGEYGRSNRSAKLSQSE